MTAELTLIRKLVLPYDSMRTMYEGGCEVRLYRNTITDTLQVGKRVDTLGLEEAVAVREAQLLRSIRHDNIVPVFDVAAVEGYDAAMRVIELVMPFYERGSVFDAFERGERFSVLEAVLHVQAGLRGLGELHERHKVLHRDVKSPNVFLDDESLLRVGDLGVAVPMEGDGSAEAYASVQLYTPPETFVSERHDRRSDIYAMGLLLFEMVNGPLPYDQYGALQLEPRLRAGKRGPLDKHLRIKPHVAPRVRTVIRKALAADPRRRYPSARAMSDAIAAARLIDWRQTVQSDDLAEWEGRVAGSTRQFRVSAASVRSGGWRLSGFQHKNAWRRIVADSHVPDLASAAAVKFFDQMLNAALIR